MLPSFLYPATPQAFTRSSPKTPNAYESPLAASQPLSSQTTLSQRFRRAIKQGDLQSAQRIAEKAFQLQQHSNPSADPCVTNTSTPTALDSPTQSRAALRAAIAQRPPWSHPFDVRNVEYTDFEGKKLKSHHRFYCFSVLFDDGLDNDSESSLVLAIKAKVDIELIRWLIDVGHEQNAPSTDADGHTVLHLSALYDRSDIMYAYSTYSMAHVAVSIAELVDWQSHYDQRSALHLACIRGFDDVARQLIDLGANLDLQDKQGNTALHFASAWGHLSLVQLLIERGCSLATKNSEGSTASDFAFSHSIKAALEAFGRARFESRKRSRRAQVAAISNASSGNGGLPPQRISFDDEYLTSGYEARAARSKPLPLPLGRPRKGSGGTYSASATPVRASFNIIRSEPTVDLDSDLFARNQVPTWKPLYEQWDAEKTFAQPGQDLYPNHLNAANGSGSHPLGNRSLLASPPRQRVASPFQLSGGSRPSIDIYNEVLCQSRQENDGATLTHSQSTWASDGEPRSKTPGGHVSGEEKLPNETATRKMLPHSQSEQQINRQYHSAAATVAHQPRTGSVREAATASPALGGGAGLGSIADRMRLKDAAAMSLFRSTTPQPQQVAGVFPDRKQSPPSPASISGGRVQPSWQASPPLPAPPAPLNGMSSLSSSLPTCSTLAENTCPTPPPPPKHDDDLTNPLRLAPHYVTHGDRY